MAEGVKDESIPKPKGRPKGTGTANQKMMRVLITPRQERLFAQLRKSDQGLSLSEHVRRALDDYIDKKIAQGVLVDHGPEGQEKVATEG
jgi:hypothetical protein